MVSLSGIVAKKGFPVVVLGARRGKDQGIFFGYHNEFAYVPFGKRDQAYKKFIQGVLDGGIDLTERLQSDNFPELRDMNLSRGRIDPESNGLVIAARYGEPSLYHIWPNGQIERNDRLLLKCGIFLQPDSDFDSSIFSEEEAVSEILDEAVFTASGGYNLIIVRAGEILDLSDYIRKGMGDATDKISREILRRLG